MLKENYQSPFRRYDMSHENSAHENSAHENSAHQNSAHQNRAHDGEPQAQRAVPRLRRQLHRVLDRHIPTGSRIALVDFPLGLDLGQSAIWLGMLSYLRHRQARIRYLADATTYDRRQLERSLGEGTILLSGGGSLGDHGKEDHQHRLRVMRDFPHRRMVQLPQSIHFGDRDLLEESRHVMDSHPRFTLLVRDRQSKVFAERKFNVEINLCPDMAWQLESLQGGAATRTSNALVVGRSVPESQRDSASEVPDVWSTAERMVPGTRRLRLATPAARRRYSLLQTSPWPLIVRTMMLRRLTMRIASDEVEQGVAQLRAARIVLTDDLSVHALCLLHNQPHLLIDDGLGCITSGWESWTHASPLVNTFGSWREGFQYARSRLDALSRSADTPRGRMAA